MDFEAIIGSPTLHWYPNIAEDDFRRPSAGSVEDNNEKEVLGHRVVLKGLKSRPDLNGCVGRCGPWIASTGRYQVAVCNKKQKREVFIVKSLNMTFAEKMKESDLFEKFTRGRPTSLGPTQVLGMWIRSASNTDEKWSPLDPLAPVSEKRDAVIVNDTYSGPLSAKALAMLEYCGRREEKTSSIMLARLPPKMAGRIRNNVPELVKQQYYEKFLEEMRKSGEARVAEWEQRLLTLRKTETWSGWLKLKVSLDGLSPTV